MIQTKWEPMRRTLHWVVARVVVADWAGVGYLFARDPAGNVLRYWTRRPAQRAAEDLNWEQVALDAWCRNRPMSYRCQWCGAPSQRPPEDQPRPVDYCHPGDHEVDG